MREGMNESKTNNRWDGLKLNYKREYRNYCTKIDYFGRWSKD